MGDGPTPESNRQLIELLLWALSILGGVIVGMALYIRHLHSKMVRMTHEVTEVTTAVKSSMDRNTDATKEQTGVLRALNDHILSNLK